jgi:hypothetical protein
MKYLVFLLFACCTCAHAQDPDFWIGAYGVSPHWNPMTRNCNSVRGVLPVIPRPPPEAPPPTVRNCLTTNTIGLARTLGLNLIGVAIETETAAVDHVERARNPWGNNAVLDVVEAAAANDLRSSIYDGRLSERFKGERIMLHPESADDFENRNSTPLQNIELFRDHQFDDNPWSTTLLQRSVLANNCVRMGQSGSVVNGITLDRIREMSVYRDWSPPTPLPPPALDTHRVSGMYQVSLILMLDPESSLPANDNTTILNVDVYYTRPDPLNPIRERIRLPLRASQLYGTPLETPVEIVVGEIEIQQSGANERRLYVTEGVHDNAATPWWLNDTRLHGSTRMDYYEWTLREIWGVADERHFDIEISYGNSDVTVLVDALCLSNPATFGLWNPDNDSTFAMHSGHRGDMENRLASICSDNGLTVNPMPGLRFLYGPEQTFTNGTYWTAFLLDRMIAEETADPLNPGIRSVQLYVPQGAWTNTAITPVISSEYASGIYTYPVLTSHPRPNLATTTPAEYYSSLYPSSQVEGFSGMWNLLRLNIETRNQFNPKGPWIPWIQNHTNLLTNNVPRGWYDGIPNREPSASELRFLCNSVLALGAKGVMFWQFSSSPFAPVANMNVADRILPNATVPWTSAIDVDMGAMGFLGHMGDETLPRELDWNGENKWDSTRTYIADFLNPIGSFMARHLVWDRGIQWHNGNGATILVSGVVSQRLDVAGGLDEQDSTYVTVSEFSQNPLDPPPDAGENARYLFVVNGRTFAGDVHATPPGTPVGQRHITVKLADLAEGQQWRVTRVLDRDSDGDIHIVRPTDTPDTWSTSNGFTEYFAPGSAALYRLEPFADETLDFDGECLSGSIFIEPAAMLRTKATDHLKFSTAEGIFCDGQFYGEMTRFESCDSELSWEGIVARNSGQVILSNVNMARGGVVAGSGGEALVDNSTIQDASVALINYGGTLTSNATTSSGVFRHLSVVESGQTGNPHTFLTRDISTGSAQYGSTAINVAFGDAAIDEVECQDFWRSVRATEGLIIGDVDGAVPQDGMNNRLSSESIGLEIEWSGYLDFGETVSDPSSCARNLIRIDDVNGYHAIAESGSSIAARQNWWDPLDLLAIPDPILIQGTVLYNYVRTDPIPFAPLRGESFASGGKLGKSETMVPTTSVRDTIRDAARRRDTTTVRNIAGRFIRSTAALIAGLQTLRSMHAALRTHGADDLIDSLLTLCLARPDVESKLLAADIAAGDSLFVDAIEILDSYSFAGSEPLMARALARKSLIHPLTGPGGYRAGLQALDSLRGMAIATDRFDDYITWYPKLFSGLTQRSGSRTPKRAYTQSILDRIIPSSIEMGQNYPNPFSAVTSFTFKLPETREVKLTVHDMLGREVAVVKQGMLDRGVHSVVLHAGRLSAGMYLYRLQAGTEVLQGRMVLVR